MAQLHLNGIQMGHVIWQLAYCLHIAAAEKSYVHACLLFLLLSALSIVHICVEKEGGPSTVTCCQI